ncbi:MAG: hypothetical protein QXF26_02160 [Candidatus Bathyarchaeia archaeon]
MSGEDIRSIRWMYVALFLGLVMLANSAVLFYISRSPSGAGDLTLITRLRSLESQLNSLSNQTSSRIAALEGQLKALNLYIQNLKVVNGSEVALLPVLYNMTIESVVLIESRVFSRGILISKSLGSGFV